MTLDEYRGALIERLHICPDAAAARSLLSEANLMLANSGMNRLTRDRFWETLEEELKAIGEDVKFLKNPKAAAALGSVVAAARARIARYRRREDGGSSATGKAE